ncbi:ABC transporter permease [Nocardiopsis changdeensis]|uniref:ABC transporter permease n=1 Tax=Nocardiopsis changdeensis TaxID=2831969 RepID=UPI003F44A05C
MRELWFARSRFGLMGGVVALIAVLMVLLSGLSSGLVEDGVSGLQRLPVHSFAFDEETEVGSSFSRSRVDEEQLREWRDRPDVAEAALFGNLLVNARSDNDVPIDLALFGVEEDSFLAPQAHEGRSLGQHDGLVVSRSAVDGGIAIGDVLTVERLGTELEVVGVLQDKHTYGHADVAYLPLSTWQEIYAGVAPGQEADPSVYTEATAVALRAEPDAGIDHAAGDSAAGTMSLPLEETFAASPGYSAETSTLDLIKAFLYAISALVVGAFFTVWTIQRKHELAVLRAMGASTGYLVRDGLGQALVILVVFCAIGLGAGVGVGSLITGSGVPFLLEGAVVATAVGLLIVLGLVGAMAAIVRISSIDPLTALGGQR